MIKALFEKASGTPSERTLKRPHPDPGALFAGVLDEIREDDKGCTVIEETPDERRYPIVVGAGGNRPLGEVVVPPGMVFLFGDMRARATAGSDRSPSTRCSGARPSCG
jgi:hypothetical protein